MAAAVRHARAHSTPSQWPLGVFIAVIWVCWDLTAKSLLEGRLLVGAVHRREITPGLDLLLTYDRPLWPLASLLGSTVAIVVLAGLIALPRRAIPAIALSVGLAGFAGDFLDQISDGRLTHFLVLHWAAITTPGFNLSEVAMAVCIGVLALDTLIRRLPRTAAPRP